MILAELSPEGQAYAVLFDRPDMAKSTRLVQAMDKINAELGRGTLVYAGSGLARQWAAVANMESPHFTTGWRQVMKVGP